MKKENQRIKLTKKLLQEALLELLQFKNIQKISISELCEKADINRATFYRHYAIPQDILVEMEREIVADVRALSPLPVNINGFEPYICKLCKYIYFHSDTIKILINHDPNFNVMRIFDDVYTIFKSTKISLNNTPLDFESIDLISAYCAGGGYYLLKKWLLDDIQKSPEEIAKIICNLFNTKFSWTIE